jgi:hypothetical protein
MTPTCICWWCEDEGTVLMELFSLGQTHREWFCEKDAADFERNCWHRVEPAEGEQLALL